MTVCCAAGCKNSSNSRDKSKPVQESSNGSEKAVKTDAKQITFYQ
jgi:hypothetical protein